MTIKNKLQTIILLTNIVLVLAIGITLFIVESYTLKEKLQEEISTLADIIASNSSVGLIFDDSATTTDTLASLKAKKNILFAYIFTTKGELFAHYTITKSTQDLLLLLPQQQRVKTETILFKDGYVDIFVPIISHAEQIGIIYIRSDLKILDKHLYTYAFTLSITAGVALLLAFFLASKLQGLIITPIQHLLQTISTISDNKDYTARAQKFSQDELGQLIDKFNNMLQQIQLRDGALLEHRNKLEEKVKQRTEELAQARDEALEHSRVKSRFLANMSHELRTPLNAVIGYSSMIKEDIDDMDKDEIIECIDFIQLAGEQLLSLISDILDISKIEAGKMELDIAQVELPVILQEVEHIIHPLLSENSNELLVKSDPSLTICETDRVHLKQILFNLLSNATKFTDKGTITLHLERDNEMMVFKVSDTGIGMTSEQSKNIFSAFVQADGSSTREYG
ncbi:MAG: HAMP domain-containing protein, partial [Proteobacteria bacterium]|nr:HAMP domain-containing protein [Pseudomonadota bacterium]